MPASGYAFAYWSGADAEDPSDNGDGTWSLTMNSDKSIVANFSLLPVNVAPDLPVLVQPADDATGVATPPTLEVTVSDDNAGDTLDVSFYGRAAGETAAADFTLIQIPDTQNHSTSNPTVLNAMFQWIANNKTARNIVFATSVGDIVNTSSSTLEWGRADTAYDYLDAANVAYSVGPGNHDLGGLYNTYFGPSRFTGNGHYQGSFVTNQNENNYSFLTASGMNFIIINLQYSPTTDQLNWADALLKANPTRRGIVVQHNILNTDNSWNSQTSYNALKDNPNLFLMLCGHMHTSTDGAAYRAEPGDDGHTIHIMMADYQDFNTAPNTGFLRILRFSPAADKIYGTTYSPPYDVSLTSTTNYDQTELVYDMPSGTAGTYTLIGTVENVANGGSASIAWSGRADNTEYEWYATVSDGTETVTGPTWSFTTGTTIATGTIIVEKQTEPDGWTATDFEFTGAAAGTIADGEQIVVSDLQPGTYYAREIVPAGWTLTDIDCDDANSVGNLPDFEAEFHLEAGETVKCTFNNLLELDFGDAPDSYSTLLASNGARHQIIAGHLLGPTIDAELDGQPSVAADRDDLLPVPDDEDGVTFPAALTAGDPAAVVLVDGGLSGGKLDAWIDFNGNSAFDPAEHLWGGASQTLPVSAGPQPLTFAVPASATPGLTYARFRLSIAGNLPPNGFAPDGEVEDYRVQIQLFTLDYAAGTGGSLTGTTHQQVAYGGSGTAVTAVPNTGYHFVDWSDSSIVNPRTDTNVTANVNVTANFAIDTFTLKYAAGANGSLTGTALQTVDYGEDGTAVTAVPNSGYHFVKWSDDSTANPRTDTNVMADVDVTASFALDTFTLKYAAGANGSLTGTALQTVDYGEDGTAVTAVPNSGYHFVKWSDDSTANPRTDTDVMADVDVTASFALDTFTLKYAAGANGSLTGTALQTVDYGEDGTAVTAVPNTGYHFVKWSDDSTANPRTDTDVMADVDVTASFALDTFTLKYAAGANGSLTGTALQTVDYGEDGTAVTAVPNSGYHFVKWSDDSTANPRTDTNVMADVDVTASFALDTFTLKYAAGAGGSLTGTALQTVDYGDDGTAVTAVPNSGYHFVKWSDDSTANPRTDTNVMADVDVTASFALDTFTLKYAAGANGSLTGTALQTVDYGEDGTAVTAVPNSWLPLCEVERRLDGQPAHGHERHGGCGRDGELCARYVHPQICGGGGRQPDGHSVADGGLR